MSAWFDTYGFAGVYPQLIVGAVPLDRRDVRRLSQLGVERVLNLVQDEEYQPGARAAVGDSLEKAAIEERRFATVDYGGLTPELLDDAVTAVNAWLDDGRTVYLHCRAGWQRSAAVAAAVIATRDNVDVDDAVATVHARKPSADPLPHQREDLRRWWKARGRNGAAVR
jgi:atypical dual specificity phosphatase